ncbi:uncharacterized protein TRIADDRAFT_64204 [Trichoplax adhaerens]|uniref:Expressed protein n=1 Tax=Trichoplax adhaerens TaxID=10228 RepID=B3S642_TRIAD|nr:expressed protein [Trichoplax adhaerens]EDV21555.1 expressed protein [Trichoplax adhaerens]|eukprot:XP_002115703.1 expressed protein [Trichoplax adhaerens]
MYKTCGIIKIFFSLGLATCAILGWNELRNLPHAWSSSALIDPFMLAVMAITAGSLSIKYDNVNSVPLTTGLIAFSIYEATFAAVNICRGTIAFYKSGSNFKQSPPVLYGFNMGFSIFFFITSLAVATFNGFKLDSFKTTEIKDPNYRFPINRRLQIAVLMLLEVAGILGILSYATNQKSIVAWFKVSAILASISALLTGFASVHDRLYMLMGSSPSKPMGSNMLILMILHDVTPYIGLGLSLFAAFAVDTETDTNVNIEKQPKTDKNYCIGNSSMIFASIQLGCAVAISPMFPSPFHSFLSFVVASLLFALGILAHLSSKTTCESLRVSTYSFTILSISSVCINVIALTVIYVVTNPYGSGIRGIDLAILIVEVINAILFMLFGSRAAEYNPVTYIRERSGTEV